MRTDPMVLRLTPRLVHKPWGGGRLAQLGRPVPHGAAIGESWEVADLPSDRGQPHRSTGRQATPVAGGPHDGLALADLIASDRDGLLGGAPDVDGRFPLLVKLLDAREPLSVQVHPPELFASRHHGMHHKAESWVVLAAEPGSHLMYGLAEGVTTRQLAAAVGTPRLVDLLRRVPAVPGEVHHVPPGTVHALGAGVLVAEVQTPSDTTFRLYDWTHEYRRERRAVHADEALECIGMAWRDNVRPGPPIPADATELGGSEHYQLARLRLAPGSARAFDGGTARVIQVLSGSLQLDGSPPPLGTGDVAVLPAAWTGVARAERRTDALVATPRR